MQNNHNLGNKLRAFSTQGKGQNICNLSSLASWLQSFLNTTVKTQLDDYTRLVNIFRNFSGD